MIISHKSSVEDNMARYNAWRTQEIKKGFNWDGEQFQIDAESQRLISAKALNVLRSLINNQTPSDIIWRTQTDTFYTFTSEEFLDFSDAVNAHVEGIMKTAWEGKDGFQ